MSGIEAAGLALAVLPVLMSAAQQYNQCLEPFRRYKRFSKEAQAYCEQLDIQRTIFRNECRHLLEEVIDHDTASIMLNALDHQVWDSKNLDDQLSSRLGESLTACQNVIGQIDSLVQAIVGESREFSSIVESEKKSTPRTIRDKIWKRNVGGKLNLAFSRSRLDENIARLRTHNDDFRVLAQQTRLAVSRTANAEPASLRSSRKDIRKYQMIGRASCQVSEALRRSCTKHQEHMAHFQLEVEHIVLNDGMAPQVKFDMAFTHRVSTGSFSPGVPFWFLIDSVTHEHPEACPNNQLEAVVELEKSLKRQLDTSTPPANNKRKKKSVRFEPPAIASPPKTCLSPITASPIILGNSISVDFCTLLKRHFHQPLQPNSYMILEDTASCKQLVYPSRRVMSQNLGKGVSLGHLIESTHDQNGVGPRLLLHERIGLAKMLAVAVLQYHSTSWLRQACCSDDILFFDLNPNAETRKGLPTPYLNARIQGRGDQTAVIQGSAIARNPILFNLGVIFLEIAHAASLQTFTRSCDADNGLVHQKFFTARRLAKSKRTDMGATYNDIVEQLVECAFPHGADLSHPEMQITFYERVISPLDELEQGLRKLGLGPEPGG